MSEHLMEDTSSPPEVADTEQVEEGDHEMDGGWEEVLNPELVLVLVQGQEQEQGGVGDELVGVVVGGNVQVEVDSAHIRQVDSSRLEGDHSFHIGSGEGEVRMWQADQVVGCDSGVKGVVVAAAQYARTNNCHDGRTVFDRRVAGLGKPE
jgi:hypothetical protein